MLRCSFIFCFLTSVAFAQEMPSSSVPVLSDSAQALVEATLPGLAGGVNASNIQQCVAKIHTNCDPLPTWEQKDLCEQQLLQTTGDLCSQAQWIYQKYGLLPNKIQAFGPVTVFTLLHIGDGQESFHMIDQSGNLIGLTDDRNPTIAQNKDFLRIQNLNPGAGLLSIISGKVSEVPTVVMPSDLGNKKGQSDVMQLIFPQLINVPPCLACQTVAVADIAYRFSYPGGNFLGIAWLKMAPTTQAKPDVVDED